jgi:hypothetical protein
VTLVTLRSSQTLTPTEGLYQHRGMRILSLFRLELIGLASYVCPAAVPYQVIAIPLIPDSTSATIRGMNDRGQVTGTFYGPGGPLANFLYTPGTGVTNIERTGPPSVQNFEGSAVTAINSSGQILLESGLLYSPDRPRQDLAPAVRTAYPAELSIRFVSLNDSGMVSGNSMVPVTSSILPDGYTQHIFRYNPASSAGVITVALARTNRQFPRGPFVMDDAQNVIYSAGFPPGGAEIFTATGLTFHTGCGPRGNGWATAINNSGQIGGGWGSTTAFAEICTLDPNTFRGSTTTLVDESSTANSGFVSGLNNKGDAVGWRGGFSSGIPTLFTSGQIVDVNSLFPSGSGWVATTADRINDAGEIAGTGTLKGVPAAFVLAPLPSASYSPQPLCVACSGMLLSNSGFAVAREASSPFGFLVRSPRGPDVEITSAASIHQINDVGAIAGSDLSGHAFIANPPYNQPWNLNSVYSWSSGAATGLNDGNDVIGFGDPASFGPAFANLRVSKLYQINNAGQITGSYLDANDRTRYFLYTPGIGIAELANQPIALSNSGHVLVSSVTGGYSLVESGAVLPLPSGFIWRALNDRDEIVGDCNDPAPSNCAAYYSPERGLVRLSVSGLNLTSAMAINNAGRILANASPLGSSEQQAVILLPDSD